MGRARILCENFISFDNSLLKLRIKTNDYVSRLLYIFLFFYEPYHVFICSEVNVIGWESLRNTITFKGEIQVKMSFLFFKLNGSF